MDNGSRFAVRSLVEDPSTKEEMATHTKGTHTGGIIDEETVTRRISLLNLEAVRLGDIPADKVTGHGQTMKATNTGPTLGEEETLPPLWADGGVMTMGTGNGGRSRTQQQRLPLRPVQKKTSQTART